MSGDPVRLRNQISENTAQPDRYFNF
jgi:hypothetical protein